MTARWEPLETADEVVAATASGKVVQRRNRHGVYTGWEEASPTSTLGVSYLMRNGREYRALIEESK